LLLIYAPAIDISGVLVKIYQLPMIVLASLFILKRTSRQGINRHELCVFILSLVAILYAAIVVIYSEPRDTEIIEYLLYGIMLSMAAAMMTDIYKKQYINYKTKIIFHIYIVGVIHAVIMILLYLFDPIRYFVYDYLVLTKTGREFVELNTRSPGLTTGGGAALSVVQATTLICGVFSVPPDKHLSFFDREGLKFIGGGSLILLSIVLSGRSGLVGIIVFFGVLCLMYFRERKQVTKYIKNFLFLISGIFVIVMSYGYLFNDNSFDRNAKWAFEVYNNYRDTGEIRTKSTDILLENMYFLPDDTADLLFGNSNLGRSDELKYLSSDVGYVRLIHSVGIIGTMLVFLPFLYILFTAIKLRRDRLALIVTGLTLIMFVMNLKELFIVLVQGWSFIYAMLTWALIGKIIK